MPPHYSAILDCVHCDIRTGYNLHLLLVHTRLECPRDHLVTGARLCQRMIEVSQDSNLHDVDDRTPTTQSISVDGVQQSWSSRLAQVFGVLKSGISWGSLYCWGIS
jgi:hypothetical protein